MLVDNNTETKHTIIVRTTCTVHKNAGKETCQHFSRNEFHCCAARMLYNN